MRQISKGDYNETSDADLNAFERVVRSRRSCRAFLRDPLPNVLIERVLEIAQQAPSWSNVQPWQVVVTRGSGTDRFREMISANAVARVPASRHFPFPHEYRDEYLARRRICGFQLYEAVGIKRGDKEGYIRQTLRNYDFFDAPHVAIVTTDEALGVYGAIDCGVYIANFMLAAQAMGIGSIAQGALAEYSESIREHFALPETRRVVCGVSFGWPDAEHPVNQYRTERADITAVVRWADA